jgi:cyanophycinase-like exopeptidase
MAVVLNGGNEFSEESDALNKALLRLVRKNKPRVLIVPVAAIDNPRKAGRGGVGYFNALRAEAELAMITDRATADDPAMSAPMETADVIYLTDGNPASAVAILADSEALARIGRAMDRGAVLAASGAAAMALCDVYWDSGVWEKGLGLLKGFVVLPHYEYVAGRFSPDRLRKDLPSGYVILGLDDSTGVIIEGQQARVVGPGSVTVFDASAEREYEDGQTLALGAETP